MVTSSLLALTLNSLASLAAGAAIASTASDSPSQSFSGSGQLRTLWNDGDHADLGCITDAGLWTANNALCGTFTATQLSSSNARSFTLASAAGPCMIYGAEFRCGQGNTAYTFGIWYIPDLIPGVDLLRYGQYGLMASWGRNPPLHEDPPQEIHLVSYREVGKYVWLAWGPSLGA